MPERTLILRLIGDDSSIKRAFASTSRGAKNLRSDLSKAERGALAGSGIFKGLGRSLAFASGGFLAFGGASAALRKSVDAAKEAQVANAQLAQQLKNNGKQFGDYREQIDRTVNRLSALAGIEDDELKSGLTTILRTVPNVSKALRDLGTAANLARAKKISLAAASTIIAKTEAGNTTLLRRQGFQIAKNATAEEALATVRKAVQGQARAGTTQQERFGAVLHQTEEIIGTALLPTINRYLASGTKWLQQMNESGKLQKDVAGAAHDVETAVSAAANVIKTADRITGSFKHTLELLIGLRLAFKLGKYAEGIGLIGTESSKAEAKTRGLRKSLLGLNEVTIAAITIPIVYEITTKILGEGGKKFFNNIGASIFDKINPGGTGALSGASGGQERAALRFAQAELQAGKNVKEVNLELIQATKFGKLTQDEIDGIIRVAVQAKAALDQIGESSRLASDAADRVRTKVKQSAVDSLTHPALTATQKNTFFDNAVDRILRRGSFGDLQQQLAAIDKATAAVKARLAVTKDLTRRLNLQDELLDLGSQRKGIVSQIAQNAKDKADARKQAAEDAKQAAKDAAARRLDALKAKQFRELGLSATGDEITPEKANLKKRVAQISANISGTTLDTPKLRAQLKRFRKVLSEGLVPKDVRAKIKEMLDGISDELKNKQQKSDFRKTSAAAIVNALGLNLSTEDRRRLQVAFAQVGKGGTVPGQRSAAFSGAGATQIINVNVDGQKMATVVTKHQRKTNQRRSPSRRGPYAGRN